MTDFFEHQRIARKKSRRVLVVFFVLMLFLLYVFNFAVYWIVGHSSLDAPYPTTYTISYDQNGAPVSTPAFPDMVGKSGAQGFVQTAVQRVFFIHPHSDALQWTIIGMFLLLFMGGFLFKFFQYYTQPLAVVQSMSHKEVFYHSNITEAERRLLNIVEEMCISAGIPVVKTYVLVNELSINAFTSGFDLRTAHIVVTQGALDQLNRDEMQAVIAHEVGHITSADVSVNTLLLSCIFSMTIIMTLGVRIIRSSGRGSSRSSKGSGGGGGGQILIVALVLIVIGALGAYCGRALQSMFSRKREFLADSMAVQYTRNPSALASALGKIRDQLFVRMKHFQAANISHMCIAASAHQGLLGIFATHPPIDERIAVLDKQYLDVHPEVKSFFDSKVTSDAAPKAEKIKTTVNIPFAQPGSSVGVQDVVLGGALLLDPKLDKALHTPNDFKYPVWGLFISEDPSIKEEQLAVLKQYYGQEFSEEKLNSTILPDNEYIESANSVVSLALARMQNLDLDAKERFWKSLEDLTMVDTVIDPFEHLIYSCFVAHSVSEKETSRIQLEHVRALLFLCAKLNRATEKDELQIYQQAIKKYMGIAPDKLEPPQPLSLEQTVTLLRQLRSRSFQMRREVLMGIKTALFGDNKITLKEFEAYRAISMALDIPAPPLHAQ